MNSFTPDEYFLSQNYPNPFNPSTTVEFSIPVKTNVVLKIFDVLGNEIVTLINEERSANIYKINFNATNLPSGVYYYTLRTENFTKTRKMLLLK